jgi:hypothetical protein
MTMPSHRQIVVVPRLGDEALVQDYPVDEGHVSVLDATRLPDGRIVTLVDRPEFAGGDERAARSYQVRTELLVAE